MLVYAEPVLSQALLTALPFAFDLRGVWLTVPLAQVLTCMIAAAGKKTAL
ncbi:MAG: hypothetical protein ACTTKL_06260 [Treponema sp.]